MRNERWREEEEEEASQSSFPIYFLSFWFFLFCFLFCLFNFDLSFIGKFFYHSQSHSMRVYYTSFTTRHVADLGSVGRGCRMRRRVAALKATVTVLFSYSRLSSFFNTIINNLPKQQLLFFRCVFFLLPLFPRNHPFVCFLILKKYSRI